jgi:cyclase
MSENMFYGASPLIFAKAKQLRNHVTHTEMILWGRLKESFPAFKFRRQHPISIYITDFYCHSLKLVIEIDGNVHLLDKVKKHDEVRENDLKSFGLTVMRFTTQDISKELESVINCIQNFILNAKQTPPPGGWGV